MSDSTYAQTFIFVTSCKEYIKQRRPTVFVRHAKNKKKGNYNILDLNTDRNVAVGLFSPEDGSSIYTETLVSAYKFTRH
jgi:hypothetical protein